MIDRYTVANFSFPPFKISYRQEGWMLFGWLTWAWSAQILVLLCEVEGGSLVYLRQGPPAYTICSLRRMHSKSCNICVCGFATLSYKSTESKVKQLFDVLTTFLYLCAIETGKIPDT